MFNLYFVKIVTITSKPKSKSPYISIKILKMKGRKKCIKGYGLGFVLAIKEKLISIVLKKFAIKKIIKIMEKT